MKPCVTIKDIAKALDISTSTVSRALSNRWDVSQETKAAVTRMAEQLNYKPNYMAVNLKIKRTKTIGLVVPEFTNSFFPTVTIGIQRILEEAGYHLLITQCNEQSETERRNINLLLNNRVEGLIISVSKEKANEELYKEVIRDGTPIVFFNRIPETIEAHKVTIDEQKMAFFATEHLIYQGYKKIYHLGGPSDLKLTYAREKGFTEATKKHLPNGVVGTVVPSGLFEDSGYETTKRLIEQQNLPEALFCFNDPVATGSLKALKDHGLKVPEDVAMVGFSETKMARMFDITSVAQPLNEMGETAARLMVEEIENGLKNSPVEHRTVCLQAKLNIRASSIKKQHTSDNNRRPEK